jgi:hypothetical protein
MRLLIVVWWLMTLAALAEPRLHFDRRVYDFGKTSIVETVTGTFTYQNTGTSELRLAPPKPTCGCTVASLKPDVLPPGGVGELVFKFKIGTSPGKHNKSITIQSNDPQEPTLSLGIRAETIKVFDLQPPMVGLGVRRLGAVTNVTATIRRVDGKPFRITGVTPSKEWIQVTPTVVDESTITLALQVRAVGPPATVYESVKVAADDAPVPAVASLTVVGQFVGPVRLEPEVLAWAIPDLKHWPDPDAEIITQQVVLVRATEPGQKFTLRNLKTSRPDLKAKLVTRQAVAEYELEVTVPRQLQDSLMGEVEFETDLPGAAVVKLPVQVRVLRR